MPVYSLLLYESMELTQIYFVNKHAVLISFSKSTMLFYATKMSLWNSFIFYLINTPDKCMDL